MTTKANEVRDMFLWYTCSEPDNPIAVTAYINWVAFEYKCDPTYVRRLWNGIAATAEARGITVKELLNVEAQKLGYNEALHYIREHATGNLEKDTDWLARVAEQYDIPVPALMRMWRDFSDINNKAVGV